MDSTQVEFGLDTFGALTEDSNGELITHAQTVRDIVDDAVLADSVGLDFFGVGEHHRPDFAVEPGDGARGDRGPHGDDPLGLGGHGAQLG